MLGAGRWRSARRPASKLLVLHTAASRVGAMDLGCVTEGGIDGGAGARRWSTTSGPTRSTCRPGPFVIYQGSHGDRGAHRADVILPGAAWTEERGHLRQHRGAAADGEPRRLPAGRGAGELGDPAGAVGGARARRCRSTRWRRCARRMVAAVPHLGRIDVVPENEWTPVAAGDYVAAATSRRRCGEHYPRQPGDAGERGDGRADAAGAASGPARPMAAE